MKRYSTIRSYCAAAAACLLLCGCGGQAYPSAVSDGDGSVAEESLPLAEEPLSVPTGTTTERESAASAAESTYVPEQTAVRTTAKQTTVKTTAKTTVKKTVPSTTATRAFTAANELRGVWIPYMDLDALLTDADPAAATQALDGMMDACVSRGMNTVYLHARAHSDAYYRSTLFPATASAAPLLAQGFDPLAYAVKAAHKRGLQLHAWVNPYRIGKDRSTARLSGDAIFCRNGVWYYNPGHEQARRLVMDGVREILQGYAVDGVHFDDYFYPTGMAAAGESFEHIPAGKDVGDWRRTQVDILVSGVYGLVHSAGRIFGISPMANLERCYDMAFADVALWMRQSGYVDYVCPQIYFGFEHETHAYPRELARWASLPRHRSVSLYIGLGLYKAGLSEDKYAGAGAAEWTKHHDILARQIRALRADGTAKGFVIYRYEDMVHPSAAAAAEWKALLPLIQQ